MPSPIFVSFEGGEGAGKTTQAEILYQRLQDAGIQAVLVREPGTTSFGSYLREYLKSERPLSKEAELLLFVAARAELVAEEIKPALDRGLIVIADRFEASSVAYQGYGRGIDLEVIHNLNSFATKGLTPNLTFLLDLDPVEGLRRGNPLQGQRRFEDQPFKFHERVRKGFLTLARNDRARWVIIDATLPVEEISGLVWRYVTGPYDCLLANNAHSA